MVDAGLRKPSVAIKLWSASRGPRSDCRGNQSVVAPPGSLSRVKGAAVDVAEVIALGGSRLVLKGTNKATAVSCAPMKPPGERKASGCPMSYDRN